MDSRLTAYARNGINQMWILKNSKDVVESLSSQSLSVIISIKTLIFQLSIPLYHILSLNHDSKTLSLIAFGLSLARDDTHTLLLYT